MTSEENEPLIENGSTVSAPTTSRRTKIIQNGIAVVCTASILINFAIAIAHAVKHESSSVLTALMGTSLGGYAIVEIILIIFVRKMHVDIGSWFLYFVAVALILQSVFVDIQFFYAK